MEQAKQIKLEPGECLSSYDVSALFTSVPVDPALNIIKDLLDKDTTLKERTVMEVRDIILLLEFCLKNTYFSFQDQFYEQVEGCKSNIDNNSHLELPNIENVSFSNGYAKLILAILMFKYLKSVTTLLSCVTFLLINMIRLE